MKSLKPFFIPALALFVVSACNNSEEKPVAEKPSAYGEYESKFKVDTRGFDESGAVITNWDCPDSRFFPPIDLTAWEKTPVVNGRFPTYEETLDGHAIHHYNGAKNPKVKLYDMTFPKLAYHVNPLTQREEVVVVIQAVKTTTDTIIGYRYLSGGVGGSVFRDFRFLNEDEIKATVEDWKNIKIGTANFDDWNNNKGTAAKSSKEKC